MLRVWALTPVLQRKHSRLREGSEDLEIVLKERNGPGGKDGNKQGAVHRAVSQGGSEEAERKAHLGI